MSKCETCHQEIKADRSSPDHRRFFALINAAFHHWPEGHEAAPRNSEDLRGWLLCKAGYCDRTPIDCEWGEYSAAMADLLRLTIEASIRAANGKGFPRVYGNRVIVFAPKSIAWDRIGQAAFNEVRDRVTAVIEQELGVTADTLLKEHEAAA